MLLLLLLMLMLILILMLLLLLPEAALEWTAKLRNPRYAHTLTIPSPTLTMHAAHALCLFHPRLPANASRFSFCHSFTRTCRHPRTRHSS